MFKLSITLNIWTYQMQILEVVCFGEKNYSGQPQCNF